MAELEKKPVKIVAQNRCFLSLIKWTRSVIMP